MNNRDFKSNIIGAFLLVLGLLQAVGTLWLFPACGAKKDGSFMKCHWTDQTLIALGVVIIVTAVIYLLGKKSYVRGGLVLSVIPIGLMTIAVPNLLIGVCGMKNMQCHAFTLPANTIIGVVYVILGVASSIYLLQEKKEWGALQNEKSFAKEVYQK